MKPNSFLLRPRGFTLIELLIVMVIIALLAGLTMGGYTYAMRGSREKTTRGTFEAVKSALENYHAEFGEYPEPASGDTTAEIVPGKVYRIGGAACLYQALSGDGYDQIKGASNSASQSGGGSAESNGRVDGDSEIKNVMMKEMPQSMWTRKNGMFILVDGFFRPFQYVKATATTTTGGTGGSSNNQPTTVNSTYDLWSYGMDEANIRARSVETVESPNMSAKWIKNW